MKVAHTEADPFLVVSEKIEACQGVAVVRLRRADGSPLPQWSPGAHIDLNLQPGMIRQYSLCGDPADNSTWQIAVLRERAGRGGSQYVHDKLAVGDHLRVCMPRNNFQIEDASHYLFIAGGIGITPIVPMTAHVNRHGAAWKLVYGGRSRSTMAFADELWRRYPGKVTLHPQDEKGLIDVDGLLRESTPDTLVYCCGPAPLLDLVREKCAHWPPGALHMERFTPELSDESVVNSSFQVDLAISGKTVTVGPDESVLHAVRACGVHVLSSCEEGICGTCETTVLEGRIEHRDSLLTDEEKEANDTMMICVSRARCPRLVLEL